MKSVFESCSEADAARAVEGVLGILENMFFSMPIPEEIMEKYNYLKESRYKKAGLPFAPITKLRYPSIGTVPKPDINKLQELDDAFMNLYSNQVLIFESILNCITERGNSLVELIKNPIRFGYFTKQYENDYSAIINDLKSKHTKALAEYKAATLQAAQPSRLTELSTDNFSQSTYKAELSQTKLLAIFDTVEDAISQYVASVKSLKSELSSASDASVLRERQLHARAENLQQQVSKLESEVRSVEVKAARQCEDVAKRIQNEHSIEVSTLRELYDKKVEGLQSSHLAEKKALEKKVAQARAEGQNSEELCDYVARLEEAIRAIRERLKAYYDYQKPLESGWKDEFASTDIQEILYTEFVIFNANKNAADNKRLTEQLAECTRELEQLRNKLDKAIMAPNPQFFKEVISYSWNRCLII